MLSGQSRALTFEKEYNGSTENVIKSVLLKKADAGVILNTELDKEPQDILNQIRTIEKTRKIPAHPLSAHPRVPFSVRAAVKKAVLALGETPSGAELLRKIWLASPVAADYVKDYRALEEIDVKKFSDWGN